MLPEEQKLGRKGSLRTAYLMCIDRLIMKEVKAEKRSIAVAQIDYQKAYDMVNKTKIICNER